MNLEDRVRKGWLLSLFAECAASVLHNFIKFILPLEGLPSLLSLIGVGVFIFLPAAAIAFWIPYYCAYRKKGTAWLMWTMILTPFSLIAELVRMSNEIPGIHVVLLYAVYAVYAYYWVNCHSLWTVNKSIRAAACSSECEWLVEEMKGALSLDSLNAKFYYGIGQWPQWQRRLTREYEAAKTKLMNDGLVAS